MRVVIRADSFTVIGSGHIMGCLTLAERLRKEKNAEVHFISRDLEGNLYEKIKEVGCCRDFCKGARPIWSS